MKRIAKPFMMNHDFYPVSAWSGTFPPLSGS